MSLYSNIMMMNWLAPILMVAPLCAQTISLGGVEVSLGMSKDTTLAKFAEAPNVNLNAMGTDWYMVLAKWTYTWHSEGSVTFHSGRLTRICVNDYESNDKPAGTLVRAFYASVASVEKGGLLSLWTSWNDDARNPLYEVHLLFKDREVVIQTGSFQGTEMASVKTYFPRVLRGAEAN